MSEPEKPATGPVPAPGDAPAAPAAAGDDVDVEGESDAARAARRARRQEARRLRNQAIAESAAAAARAEPPSAALLRAARARRLRWRYLIGVGVPTVLAIVYYLLLASPQYDARATATIDAVADRSGKDARIRDARLVVEYLQSPAGLDALDARAGLLKGYRAKAIDWWSRLGPAGDDDELAYFRKMVALEVAPDSGTISIRTRAFSPVAARAIADAVLAQAEQWIAERAARRETQRLGTASADVEAARSALATARDAAAATTAAPEPASDAATSAAVDVEAASQVLAAAIASQQRVRDDLAGQRVELVVLSPPRATTMPAAPRRAWSIATVAVVSAVLISILSLLGATVREHANH
jgi:capsule polysaccharide export protein KpsE/RkpR